MRQGSKIKPDKSSHHGTIERIPAVAGILLLLASAASGLYAATAVVVDETGKPVPSALVQFIQPGGVSAAAAGVTTAADGSVTLPSLTGPVDVCIQVPGNTAGYVNPCLWPTQKLTLPSLSASALAPLQLTVKKGAVATVRVNDPTGVLAANPKEPLFVGVFAPGGMFYMARQTAVDKTGRSYSLTIPYGVDASLLIHSTYFAISDSTGKAIPATGLSLPFLQNSGAKSLAALVYTITGKK